MIKLLIFTALSLMRKTMGIAQEELTLVDVQRFLTSRLKGQIQMRMAGLLTRAPY